MGLLLALGLRGCDADGWRPRERTPIHDVVGAPALLLYGGQVRSCYLRDPMQQAGGAACCMQRGVRWI